MYINPAASVAALGTSIGSRSLFGRSNATVGPWQVLSNGADITSMLDGTANANFPPRSWLGFGIDMTTVTPVDITSVASSVLTHSRIIRLKSAGRQEKLDGAVSWFVPNGVNVKQDVGSGKTSYNSFKSGDKAASSIAIDASLAANYMAIGGDISANYAIQKTFQKQYQYAMFAFNQVLLEVGFDDYAKTVDEVLLLRRLRRMDPFDPRKPGVIQQYRSLFATIGTHIITGANYGGRLQLLVWADNSDQSVDEEFGIDVAAEFNGLTTSGKVDVRVKSEKQFQTFEQSVMKSSSCLGGDPKLSANIGSNPSSDGIFETFQTWVKTADTNPKIMSFQTIALWDLMSAARSDVLAKRAPDIAKAYQWIVENPEQHLTKARMVISSDWGEVGISTPSAYILKDPSQPDIPGLLYSATKVSWTANGGPPTQMTIDFIISNDGSPIDIELSHGSNGSTEGKGQIVVSFNQKSYLNDATHDNNWNSQTFYACPVDPHGRVPHHVTATA